MIRKTKIVCTLGPASDSEEMISKLMDAGMNVCRLNMSHGSYEEQGARIDRIKRLRAEKNIPVAIMLDTKGPEVRTKTLKGDKVTLQAGQDFILTSRDIEGDETQVSITYPKMVDLVHAGTRVLIDDGLIALDVKQIVNGTDIVCTVINGGVLGGRKGISVPDVDLQMPSIGEKDRSDIIFGIEKGIDLIAASFVCRPSDVLTIRKLCADNGGSYVQIFSKIENRMGVNNFDEILKVSDGIMVARGDLGVEVGDAELVGIQKRIIQHARTLNKVVITATQMMESMISSPMPTRAEVSDVANAVLDYTDAVMLSAESASGQYPVEAVQAMARVCLGAEKHPTTTKSHHRVGETFTRCDETIALAAMYAANHFPGVKAVIALTESGHTPLIMSRIRSGVPIYCYSPHSLTQNRVAMFRGVYTVPFAPSDYEPADLSNAAIDELRKRNLVKTGDWVILTKGDFYRDSGGTNGMKILLVD